MRPIHYLLIVVAFVVMIFLGTPAGADAPMHRVDVIQAQQLDGESLQVMVLCRSPGPKGSTARVAFLTGNGSIDSWPGLRSASGGVVPAASLRPCTPESYYTISLMQKDELVPGVTWYLVCIEGMVWEVLATGHGVDVWPGTDRKEAGVMSGVMPVDFMPMCKP